MVFDSYCVGIYENLNAPDLDPDIFNKAMKGYWRLRAANKLENTRYITVCDFTQSANEKRMYIIDLENYKVVLQTYVAHGMNTGREYAEDFSNEERSGQSSLGFFVTGEPYTGRRGYSLKLDGQESGYNTNVRKRGVVIHGADYATKEFIKKNGRLGRSQGCPAVSPELNKKIIHLLRGKSCFFIYAKDRSYRRHSRYIRGTRHLEAIYADQVSECSSTQ